MNPRSLVFRLITWYSGLFALVAFAFGAYAYHRLDTFLYEVLQTFLQRRASQIVNGLAIDVPIKGVAYFESEMDARYTPAINDRFIRVTRRDGTVLYVSGEPNDRSFSPAKIGPYLGAWRSNSVRRVQLPKDDDVLIAMQSFEVSSRQYNLEVGSSMGGGYRVLISLLKTLLVGLPLLIFIVVAGGYILIKQALNPVRNMIGAAQEISLHRLSRRLPIPASGDEFASLSRNYSKLNSRGDAEARSKRSGELLAH